MSEPYVDETFYKNDYEGSPVESADFSRFSKRASDIVDSLTEYKIPEIGLDKFSDSVQLLVKKACCAQIEYYQTEGIELDATGNTRSGGSVSIGGFSYSGAIAPSNRQESRVAPSCLAFLEGTGLLRKRSVRIGVV